MTEDGFSLIDFYEEMIEQESDAFTFVVKRKPEEGRSLSAEAMDQLRNVFAAFVSARLSADLRRRGPDGPGHSEVQIDLKVTINGGSHTVGEDAHPWYALVDGEHRVMH
jgi:hypothetical protein